MNPDFKKIVIACGGTGGHLFPGIAVGLELQQLGHHVVLLISPKEIDRRVKRIGGNNQRLLAGMADHMTTFKRLMDISTETEMNELCQQYIGLRRYAKLLEQVAGGIARGDIRVPPA